MVNPYSSPASASIRAPIVRAISWPAVVPQLVVLAAAISAASLVFPTRANAWIAGSAIYLAYALGSRMLIAHAHRRGIRLVRRHQYEAAIEAFEESHQFFAQHLWIDRFRSIILMSPSAITYREMALCNIAFCWTQLGDGQKAKQYYQRVLDEFPANGLAISAMKMAQAFERQ